jgi:signal transduction histidine kinase/AraC-like DNA-binding protein/ABC-type sugar transport system substrate-binding protein/DNA-binding response OmpR family regulator
MLMTHTLRIGSQIGPADPFWVQVREAVYQKAQQLAINLIPIEMADRPELLSREEQASLVEELLAQELDALICWNLSDSLIYHILDCDLPIIYLAERELQHSLFVSPIGLYDTGQIVGAYFAEQLGGRGRVLCIGGLSEPGGEGAGSRLAGIRDALRVYSDISLEHIPCFWRYEQAYPQIEAVMRRLGLPIDAIFGLSDSLALAARDAGQALGLVNPHTLIAGVNGDPLALAAIAEGSLSATVETSAADFGGQAVELACRAAHRQSLPTHFSFKPRLVTVENVAEVAMQKLIAIADLPTRLVGVNRQQEQNRLTQLETSAAINRRVGSLLDRQRLSQEIANLIRANYGYDHVQLWLWSESEQLLILDQPEQTPGTRTVLPLEKSGLLKEALRRNEPIFIPDTRYRHRFPPDPNWPETHSRVVLPIRLGDQILGLLDLHSRRPTLHLRQELIGLQSLADQLGIAMRNAELYAEALQARAVAEKADQLKTRLLANVGHELRAPLNVILGYTEAALAVPNAYALDLPPTLRQDLGHIYRSCEHLIRLINDLLDLSRAEIDELDLFPETIATRSFLEEVFHSQADTSPNKVTWKLQLPARLPVIHADPVRLRQILLNLLSNALKFTPTGQITLGAEVEPPHLHLWVQDTGIGIPIDLQERIFEPFMTGEHPGRRSEGIGLGLCITRRLVALHGGSMTLESQLDLGSTFHVYLPLPNLTGQWAAPLSTTAQPVLLLLSSQAQPAASILELTQRQGLTLRRLQVRENLDALLRETQPAALAWDLTNARADEWTLIQQLRSHPQLCQLPFILFGQETEVTSGLRLGITNVLMKPVSGKTLMETINALRPPQVTGPVLIVDDDPEARALYQRTAAEALPGYPILMAENGAAALTVLAQETPSLVILDLMMPEVDGFTVLERMRAERRTQQVPVLVMSGQMLSMEDVRRLDYARVTFQSKGILSQAEAIASLQQAFTGEERLPPPTSALVKRALAYLHQNYTQPLSRQEIADAVGVSENYLSQIFRQEMGLSPWECLNRFRIQQAKEMLRNTEASVTTVALRVGFKDSAYFSRVFHKYVGRSPQAYRQHRS